MTKTDSRTQEFRKFLATGRPVSEAAACAGISPDELPKFLGDVEIERRRDVVPLATVAFDHLMDAVETLSELAADAAEDKDRIAAAKALLDFAVKCQTLRIGQDVADKTANTTAASLWDFSKPA